MEDLDLDELDKQVNKMMSKPRNKRLRSSRPPQAITRPNDTPAPQPSQPVVATPVVSEPASSPVPQPERANRPLPTIPTRSRLRPVVMDIVSTAPTKATAPSARPTRTSADIRPPSKAEPSEKTQSVESPQEVTNKVMAALSMDDIRPAPRPRQSLASQENESQEPPQDKAPVAEPEPAEQKPKWPDPLDFLDYDRPKPKEEPAPKPAEEPVQEPQPAASIPEPTPFVTTKVEKRPLGAYASVQSEPSEPEAPAEPEAPIAPAETNKGEMAAASLQSQQHLQDTQPSPQDLQSMTIPQQYHAAQPEPTDQVRSMYDTKEYHAPPQLMYHSRKGSPWFVVGVVALITLIIILVLVGYFMATGTFNIKFGNISSLA